MELRCINEQVLENRPDITESMTDDVHLLVDAAITSDMNGIQEEAENGIKI
jgi:hypothetical protein